MRTRLNVLVIDDVPVNRFLLESIAGEIGGLQVSSASDGAEALDWCRRNQADVVVVDWMMPGMDGFAFLQAFRADPANEGVPVVMITANDDRAVRQKALDLGANDFLVRPLQPAEVRGRLRNMLTLRRAHLALAHQAQVLSEQVAAATAQLRARERELVSRLAGALEHRDPETGAHVVRMALYSRLIAERLGLPAEFQEMLLAAAPMHDIGKVGIPDYILLKPGRLTPDELTIMRRHAELGGRILDGSESELVRMAQRIAMGHHEKWDGTGYPQGLSGTAIPIEARIVAVADVFDALTSERPYKPAWSLEEARAHLLALRGAHFDPDCVDAFLAGWDKVLQIRTEHADPVTASLADD
ncbi:HD domain-containing phosphohydrolase [Oleisolibacter albus]|uniref:HD domain-containing phosphohydrolase n=1 Tax=Oleisolibacter albus TaxID=2171757 RepID=UPI000DF3BADC|nr:HD domain-containing phosphohydrolase [Oleisolibacter albus]